MRPELDLVEQEDQLSHEVSLLDEIDAENGLGMPWLKLTFSYNLILYLHVHRNDMVLLQISLVQIQNLWRTRRSMKN